MISIPFALLIMHISFLSAQDSNYPNSLAHPPKSLSCFLIGMCFLSIPHSYIPQQKLCPNPSPDTKGWGRQEGIDCFKITACLDLCPNTSVHDKVVSKTFVEKYMVEKTTQKLTSFENWTQHRVQELSSHRLFTCGLSIFLM